ncbi:MAG TPA: PAS domain S-box protein [Terracidiphilus sp.]|nr:PAS domain S-box protein [Terracidiphilus sp.]
MNASGAHTTRHTTQQPEWQMPLAEVLAQAPFGIGLLKCANHRWVYINDSFVRMTGRSNPADFLGNTVRESLPETETQGFLDVLYRACASGETCRVLEMKLSLNRPHAAQPKEGYFDFGFQPVRDSNGQTNSVLIHALEVTANVKARKVLEDTTKRFRLAQSAAQIGTWEWDPVEDRNALSSELYRMFGTSRSDPESAKRWMERVLPEDWPMVSQLMMEGHRRGKMEFEYRYQHPENGVRWFFCKGRRARGETRMYGIVQDITARKAAQEASQRLAAIVECSDDAIAGKDLAGIVTSWNRSAERMFGYTAEEMVGRPITTIIPPELHKDEATILATIGRGERIDHFETVRVNKAGERIDVSLTVSPVRNEHGDIVGAAKIARDITQQRKAERALRTSERLASVGRLAATVAHEINNPLEAITNLVFLAKSATSREDANKFLAMAEDELTRVSHLTRQTLGFYREPRQVARVGVGELIESLASVFTARARSRGIKVQAEISENAASLNVPAEMRQVLANLVANSMDAMEGGGLVRIRASAARRPQGDREHGVRLTIADTGSGIPATVRPKLFEPFFTTKKDVGTGLGLWVCKGIVENNRGTIHLKSCAEPGRSWTAFSVFLPLKAGAGAAAQEMLARRSSELLKKTA